MELDLFGDNEERKTKLGHSDLEYVRASSILTAASGFMADYDYTLNVYSGCSFGCTYCYAAFFSRDKQKMDTWGRWVNIKENAIQLLQKFRKKPLVNKSIYMGSVTDPYQPIEKELNLTRQILQELLDYHKVRLVIQTRSPLVTRDIDLLKKFETVQVNMTVTTDSERIRKVFEPYCPGNSMRIKAITEVHNAGIGSCITLTPLLPVENPHDFAKELLATGIKKFIVQPFHAERGKFVAGTRDAALEILKEFGWSVEEYKKVESILIQYIPEIGIGKKGFKPI